MNKPISVVVALIATTTFAPAQSLLEVGYFPFNGLFACSGYEQYMITGAGHMVDITDPAMPQLGPIASIGFGTAVMVAGDRAYFGTGMQPVVKVVDLTVPSAPLTLGSVPLPASAGVFDLAIQGNVLYAANAQGGLVSIDVTDPQVPFILQAFAIPGGQQARGVAVNGNYAYVADGNGLKVVDISDPEDMQVISSTGSNFVSVSMESDGTTLAVGQNGGGALLFSLADPASPQILYGVPESDGPAYRVQLHDDRLLVTSEQFGVRIYTLGPNSAALLGSFDNSANGQTFSAFAHDDLVYVTGLVNGAAILSWGTVGIGSDLPSPVQGRLYPVPTKDVLNWTNDFQEQSGAYTVTDVTGRTILIGRISGTFIDVSGLTPGVYRLAMVEQGKVMRSAPFLRE